MQLLADVQNLELSNFADPCPNGCLAGSGSFRQLVGTTPLPTKALSAHPVETPCNHLCQATFVGNSFDWFSVANLSHRADLGHVQPSRWNCPRPVCMSRPVRSRCGTTRRAPVGAGCRPDETSEEASLKNTKLLIGGPWTAAPPRENEQVRPPFDGGGGGGVPPAFA